MAKENYKVESILKYFPLAVGIYRYLFSVYDRIRFGRLIDVKLNGRSIFKMVDMGNTTRMRANTFASKEPETIAWIESFKEGETLMDIGANVGAYSLYAASRGHDVMSVEPDALNFALLNLNVACNKYSGKITPYALAVHIGQKLSVLNTGILEWGVARSSFDNALDWQLNHYDVAHSHVIYGMSIDSLVDQSGFEPSHIKIDVDGNENLILAGASRTLSSPRLKSVLVELDKTRCDYDSCIQMIVSHGFELVLAERSSMFDFSATRNCYNHIFRRS